MRNNVFNILIASIFTSNLLLILADLLYLLQLCLYTAVALTLQAYTSSVYNLQYLASSH